MWKEQRYQLWAVLRGFMVWPALPTLLSWAISFYDPLTCGPGDVARGARLLSLRTNSWYVALALSSSASVGHLAFQSTHRGKKMVTIPFLLWWTRTYIGADVRDGGVVPEILQPFLHSMPLESIRYPVHTGETYLGWFGLFSEVAMVANASSQVSRNWVTAEKSGRSQSQKDAEEARCVWSVTQE